MAICVDTEFDILCNLLENFHFAPSENPPSELLPPSYFQGAPCAPEEKLCRVPGKFSSELMPPSDFRSGDLMTPADFKRKRPYPKGENKKVKIPRRLDEEFK